MTEVRVRTGPLPSLAPLLVGVGALASLGAAIALVVGMSAGSSSLRSAALGIAATLGLIGVVGGLLGGFMRRMGVFVSEQGLRRVLVRTRAIRWRDVRTTRISTGMAERMLEIEVDGQSPLRISSAEVGAIWPLDPGPLRALQELVERHASRAPLDE